MYKILWALYNQSLSLSPKHIWQINITIQKPSIQSQGHAATDKCFQSYRCSKDVQGCECENSNCVKLIELVMIPDPSQRCLKEVHDECRWKHNSFEKYLPSLTWVSDVLVEEMNSWSNSCIYCAATCQPRLIFLPNMIKISITANCGHLYPTNTKIIRFGPQSYVPESCT